MALIHYSDIIIVTLYHEMYHTILDYHGVIGGLRKKSSLFSLIS